MTTTATTPTPKTADELEALKSNWLKDPCWDLEDTDGFEAHYDELLAFRLQDEAMRSASYKRRLEQAAARLGIPDNLTLAEVVVGLEERVRDLLERVDALDAGVAENNRLRVESYSWR